MIKISVTTLIKRLQRRNIASAHRAKWCRDCLQCVITRNDTTGKTSPVMHRGSDLCDHYLKQGTLAECIKDLKGRQASGKDTKISPH